MLDSADRFHLSAAIGWVGLGNWREANEELEKITPALRSHAEVLSVRYEIYAMAGKWDGAADLALVLRDGQPASAERWIKLAYATRRKPEGGGVVEAQKILHEASERFLNEAIIFYNLACYACQLGDLKGAATLLEKAFGMGDAKQLKLMALDDSDLEPLWAAIRA